MSSAAKAHGWQTVGKRQAIGGLALAALLLVSAAPAQQSLELVRRGNDAFAQEDLDAALDFYEQAEERINDPGLVSYNEGVTLYRLRRFREAVLHFRRCIEGADAERKARGYYGLGNALVMDSGGEDVAALEDAVESYRLCRRQPGIPQELLDKANHNLELARLLLLQAKAAAAARPKDQDAGGSSPKQKNQAKKPGDNTGEEPGDPGDNDPEAGSNKSKNSGKEKPLRTDQTTPGAGHLRTIPDEDKLAPLSPEDAQALLQQEVRRIEQERRQGWHAATQPARNVKDW